MMKTIETNCHSSFSLFRAGGMYISTAITYQTHIEAGQGRGRSVDDEDGLGVGYDDGDVCDCIGGQMRTYEKII